MKPEIQAKFATYPVEAQEQLKSIRRLVFSVAEENDLGTVEETLKWGELSYLVNGGSTIRMDWKSNDPDFIKVYFHCQTSLVETFREIYRYEFTYEGKRAIVIPLGASDSGPLRHCLQMALKYHRLKHLPLLGA
ncbi:MULTISPECIES: DUF1801 domain-containing protein [unclassified Arsukibacterium]|uniref:DUF1801 domain-containing protein n=1 Tax=unclassified Arsukibacterium TaxID=2635278 RepID=UPI000C3B9B9A|nr:MULTISPECIES: DUF1801 domain-containing protein [unclassified Arsukibacterium]MBM33116.1 hypothetical protein [Rheinheimera sp.]HAW92057.1 hypothetical protein [Candidatus Azambacteria bacterium]